MFNNFFIQYENIKILFKLFQKNYYIIINLFITIMLQVYFKFIKVN